MSARLQALLDQGVVAGMFPCARAVVVRHGTRVFEGGAGGATSRTTFDLASLTKVMATTTVFLSLWRDGVVAPETPVSRACPGPGAGRAGTTVADLLYHRSGLPAFLPFFASVLREFPRLLDRDCPPEIRAAGRRRVVEQVLATPAARLPGTRAIYSDVGFIVLGELLSRVAAAPLDALFAERVAAPLRLSARFQRLSTGAGAMDAVADVAPTGATRPREPAPGQEGLWEPLTSRPSAAGEVDDDNAWVMDGVAGHAGLFGTADDVAAFGQAVLDEVAGAARIAPAQLWAVALRRDPLTPGSTRALGFETRAPADHPAGSSAGTAIGSLPPGAVGHVGFTGVSLWVDLARRLVVALCTNRTAGGRGDTRVRELRPRFHDAVIESLGGTG